VEIVEDLALPAQTQIKSLRGRVRVLTGALVASFAVFIGGFSWIAYNLQVTPAELLTTTQTRLKN